MDESIIAPVIITALYKVSCLIVGVLFAFMGYKLFQAGLYRESGDMEATWGKNTLILKKGAPGTFFALFGCLVIMLAIYKGLTIDAPGGERNTSVHGIMPTAATAQGRTPTDLSVDPFLGSSAIKLYTEKGGIDHPDWFEALMVTPKQPYINQFNLHDSTTANQPAVFLVPKFPSELGWLRAKRENWLTLCQQIIHRDQPNLETGKTVAGPATPDDFKEFQEWFDIKVMPAKEMLSSEPLNN